MGGPKGPGAGVPEVEVELEQPQGSHEQQSPGVLIMGGPTSGGDGKVVLKDPGGQPAVSGVMAMTT